MASRIIQSVQTVQYVTSGDIQPGDSVVTAPGPGAPVGNRCSPLVITTISSYLSTLMFKKKYKFSSLSPIEQIQFYQPQEFHPVSIGDIYADGRYKILHKLGYGGLSTVWLARDLRPQPGDSDTLVALKILSSDSSSKPTDEIPQTFMSSISLMRSLVPRITPLVKIS